MTSELCESKRMSAICLFAVIIVAFLLLPRSGVTTSHNSAFYLTRGLQMYGGELPAAFNRGPVFSLLIAASYRIFGVSVWSGFFVTRCFYSLGAVVLFVLGRKLFNSWAGLIVSFLYLFSYGVNSMASKLDADTMVPCLIMLSIYLCLVAFERRTILSFVLLGMTLGLAILTKEIAVMFVPLPFMYAVCVPLYRQRKTLLCLGVYILCVVLVILPWVFLAYLKTGHPLQVVGFIRPGGVLVKSGGAQVYLDVVLRHFSNPLHNFKMFFLVYIRPYSSLYPVIFASWMWLVCRWFRERSLKDLILLLSGLLVLPAIIFLGTHHSRLGQVGFLYCLSYVVMSGFVVELIRFVRRKCCGDRGGKLLWSFVTVGCLGLLLVIELLYPHKSSWSYMVKGNPWKNTFWLSSQFGVGGRFDESVKQGAVWLKNHADAESVVLTGKSTYEPIRFFTMEQYENYSLDLYRSVSMLTDAADEVDYEGDDKVLFVFPNQRFGGVSERHQSIYIILEKDLLRELGDRKPSYLIASFKEGFLWLYLENTEWAERVYSNAGLRIYRIDLAGIEPNRSFEWISGNSLRTQYDAFCRRYPQKAAESRNCLARLGMIPEDLMTHSYENYQKNWVEKNISEGARIAYSFSMGICDIVDDKKYCVEKFNKDSNLSSFEEKYDYLFIHNSRIRRNEFPVLFEELESLEPVKSFPQVVYFGDGWVIYKLSKLPGKNEN